jgi:hypothetical protein
VAIYLVGTLESINDLLVASFQGPTFVASSPHS